MNWTKEILVQFFFDMIVLEFLQQFHQMYF